MYRLQVKTHFDAAHYIKDYQGKCNRMHGHRWEVEAVLEGTKLDNLNMLIDFSTVKGVLRECCERLDHYVINEQLNEPNVTAEFLAKWFYDRIGDGLDTKLVSVAIWESPDCCVEYYGST